MSRKTNELRTRSRSISSPNCSQHDLLCRSRAARWGFEAAGHAGEPFYISGPHETATQVRTIVDQLQRRLGPGNFEYLVLAQ
jgi:hypothetical protein